MAELGLCSRREADSLIESGQVFVNGVKAVMGQKVTAADTITLDGPTKELVYLAYYKGRGIITHSPDTHETDIAMRLKKDYGLTNIYPVGRLDKDSEGLMLLTNDGRITGPLLDPAAAHEKEYEVELDKPITNHLVKHLERGVDIEGYLTKPATAHKTSEQRLRLVITEGKKHQIRRMCAALGYQVQSLKRVRIMHIELGKLKPNQYRHLTKTETKQLLTTLGIQR